MARPTIASKTTPNIATNADGTSAVGASFTPTANTAVLVLATVRRGSGTADDFSVTHSGSLGTLTAGSINETHSHGAVANGARFKSFYAYAGASPTAGTLTITCTNTHTSFLLQCFEITNPHLTQLEKQTGKTNEAVDTTGPVTATLLSAVTANSLVVACYSSDNGAAATITGPAASDWGTALADSNVATAASVRQVVHFCTTEQTAAEYSTSSACDILVAIMEFGEAAATGGGSSGSSAITAAQVRKIQVVPV